MKFVLAPDSFKESMTAKEVADAMERGIKKIIPEAECIKVPMADGGEGTTQSLVDATGGEIHLVDVRGPLGEKVESKIGILGDGETAVIEMADASGLQLISKEDRDPLLTTTFGTGELILNALEKGVKHLLIGIGGSATNDGGAGMFQALGGKLLDIEGRELPPGGGFLGSLHKIDISSLDSRLKDVSVEVACDVNNPLTGLTGASHIFGPQKGAVPEVVERLDKNLVHYAAIIREQLGIEVETIAGAGAAGGLGAGLMAFLDAQLVRGIDLVIAHTGLEEATSHADYVLTGEGSIDAQTLYGKTPIGVSKLAKKYGVPTIVLAGSLGGGVDILYDHGITAIFNILQTPCELDIALETGLINVEKTSENIARLLRLNNI
nr:glycerate kinase [Tissierella sp.]